jgi:hypothetical protein
MRRQRVLIVAAVLLGALSGRLFSPPKAYADECVVLLHGLARTERSMQKLDDYLQLQGFQVANVDYPSKKEKIENLAPAAITKGLVHCREAQAHKIHFVTHSMGAILVRYYLAYNDIPELGRIVMLSPPNQGTEVVDKLGDLSAFNWLNGPAGQQLGTDARNLPQTLGAVKYEVGIITGDRTINPILSLLIPGADDGKVSVERAKIKGMKDFLIVHKSHTFIMRDPEVLKQTNVFLHKGSFD